jgi:FSR family fosmidomycin resistance protein-like MFS transporter
VVPGVIAVPLSVLTGATLLASNSVTVVQGQELLPGNTGIASGLTLGLAFGLSGVITLALTSVSDAAGVSTAIFVLPFVTVLAAACAWLVPDAGARRTRKDRLSVPPLGMTGAG